MIRAVQADEGLGVARRLEDDPGIAEAHNLVVRRVDDQQRLAQRGDALALCRHVAPADQLSGIGRGSDGHHGVRLGHLACDGQNRCPAE
jgi:hypothetical protein